MEILQEEVRKRDNIIDALKQKSKESGADSFAEERKALTGKLKKAEQDTKELKRRINEAASNSKKKLEEAEKSFASQFKWVVARPLHWNSTKSTSLTELSSRREQKTKMAELSADLAQRTELAENLKAHVVDIEEQLHERNEECKELRSAAQNQADGANGDREQLEEMTESLRQLKREKVEMKQKLKATEKELQKSATSSASSSAISADEETRLRELVERLQSEAGALTAKLKDAESRNEDLLHGQEEQRGKLEAMKIKWSDSQKDLEGLKEAAAIAATAKAAASSAAQVRAEDGPSAGISVAQKEALAAELKREIEAL